MKSKHGVKPSCLGKGGNLPTDETSQHFNLERKVIYYEEIDEDDDDDDE